MADHYRDNPHVVGWQTDNELNTSASESHSPSCRLEFQKNLTHAHADIHGLNQAWDGAFWALDYDRFGQIDLTRQMTSTFISPGNLQNYHRFLAHATAVFQHDQVVILLEHQLRPIHFPQPWQPCRHRLSRAVWPGFGFHRL